MANIPGPACRMLSWEEMGAGPCFTTGSGMEDRFAAFADFHGVNTPAVASCKLLSIELGREMQEASVLTSCQWGLASGFQNQAPQVPSSQPWSCDVRPPAPHKKPWLDPGSLLHPVPKQGNHGRKQIPRVGAFHSQTLTAKSTKPHYRMPDASLCVCECVLEKG